MRSDVKVGMALALAFVLVGGFYYFRADERQEPVSLAGGPATAEGNSGLTPSKDAVGRSEKNGSAKRDAHKPARARSDNSKSPDRSAAKSRPTRNVKNRKAGNEPKAKTSPIRRAGAPKKAAARRETSKRQPKSDQTKHDLDRAVAAGSQGKPGTAARGIDDQTNAAASKGGRERPNTPSKGRSDVKGESTRRRAGTAASGTAARAEEKGRSARRDGRKPMAPKTASKSARSATKRAARNVAMDTHKIRSGDTLSSVAEMYYGHQKYADLLVRTNPEITNPDRLRIGQVIRIPPSPDHTIATHPATDPLVNTGASTKKGRSRGTYTVRAGDSFWSIAQEQLGDGKRWNELFELNREATHGDPDRLRLGQVINLPPRERTKTGR